MKLKYCLLSLLLLFFPLYVSAEEYTDYNAKVKYTVDYNWEDDDLNEEREYISKKWKNDCGLLMYGSTDFYGSLSSDEKGGLSRKDFNSSIINSTFAEDFVSQYKTQYSINDYQLQYYNLTFIDMYGSINYYGVETGLDIYSSVNNGYLLLLQYFGDSSNYCVDLVDDVAKSFKSTVIDNNSSNNSTYNNITNDSGDLDYVKIISMILLTAFSYMIFPIIRLIVNKSKFIDERAKKIALWNSIVVGGIFCIITISIGESISWKPFPAILYYWINFAILRNHNSNREETEKEKNNTLDYTICKCGCKVLKEFKKCPKCGKKVK